jgi:hypothetical protein
MAFSDETKLYFVMDFVQGGEMYKHLKDRKKFTN